MLPWQKSRQRVRENSARVVETPHWAGTIPEGTIVKKCLNDHFINTPNGDKFLLHLGFTVEHSQRGTIPAKASCPAITPLGDTMFFPYRNELCTAMANSAITRIAHTNGMRAHLRLTVDRMDSSSWELLIDDVTSLDTPPMRYTWDSSRAEGFCDPLPAEPLFEQSSLTVEADQVMQIVVEQYRRSPHAMEAHSQTPEPERAAPTVEPTRFSFLKLFR